jgi:hypothetical protein
MRGLVKTQMRTRLIQLKAWEHVKHEQISDQKGRLYLQAKVGFITVQIKTDPETISHVFR